MVGPIDMKPKGSSSNGYCINYVTFTFYLTCDLDLDFSRSNFENSCIWGIVPLIDVKQKDSESVRFWADNMTLSFDHTHDLNLEISRSEFEIVLSQEWYEWDVIHPFTGLPRTPGKWEKLLNLKTLFPAVKKPGNLVLGKLIFLILSLKQRPCYWNTSVCCLFVFTKSTNFPSFHPEVLDTMGPRFLSVKFKGWMDRQAPIVMSHMRTELRGSHHKI